MRAFLIGLVVLLQTTGNLPEAIKVAGLVPTHDPSIAREGDTYYVFATGRARDGGQIPIHCSEDLKVWRGCGKVFAAVPDWIQKVSPGTRDLWAPDISFEHGEYRLYYAYSIYGKRTSGIALMTNKTLDPTGEGYAWVDKGLVISTSQEDDFNAIDPAYTEDDKGKGWLAFGSYWSGIKMREVDTATGLLSGKKQYSLAKREDGPEESSLEAPSVLEHEGYYYLFVSVGFCCRGARSTYRTMVGRAKKVTGPYVDAIGKKMMDGGGTVLLAGNSVWAGPGGETVMHDKDRDLMVFHAYDRVTGRPQLQVSTMVWVDGWPKVAMLGE